MLSPFPAAAGLGIAPPPPKKKNPHLQLHLHAIHGHHLVLRGRRRGQGGERKALLMEMQAGPATGPQAEAPLLQNPELPGAAVPRGGCRAALEQPPLALARHKAALCPRWASGGIRLRSRAPGKHKESVQGQQTLWDRCSRPNAVPAELSAGITGRGGTWWGLLLLQPPWRGGERLGWAAGGTARWLSRAPEPGDFPPEKVKRKAWVPGRVLQESSEGLRLGVGLETEDVYK